MESQSVQEFLRKISGVHIGVDIGQKVDHTAIVVVEVSERGGQEIRIDYRDGLPHQVPESVYRVQELRRLPLGTPFVAVAKEIVDLVGAVWEMEGQLRAAGTLLVYERSLGVDVFLDATGLGAPIVELVTNALRVSAKTDRAMVHPVVFTYGDRFVRGGYEDQGDSLGKAYLVNRLQILLEQDRLDLPKGDPELDAMIEELKAYEIRIDTDANEKYGAFAVGAHDDMVTALGLACVEEPGFYGVEQGPALW
jgi:hypothetical protein